MLRTLVLPLFVLFWLAAASQTFAHCQVPCGIYDDHARVKAMMEDVATIEKAARNILVLADKADAQSQNQLVRWVMNKESHAENLINSISNYFLTQRVKASQEDYEARLVKHHAVIVGAMKAKQTVDTKLVDELMADVKALLVYYPEHQHD